VNLYAGNGFVAVPVSGHRFDADALRIIGAQYPGREVLAVPGVVLAYGGGGVHCITQQVPA
ncbi:MAG TPA: agmatine deiminase family protein, partial [Acidimicrobiia bacterium]|nr:agmatine deiminase family protein [Acidimicrobiia bacterium]